MSEPPVRDRPLSITDACIAMGGIHRATLYREHRDGRLTITKIRGSSFVMESEIERYLHDRDRRLPRKAA